MPSQRIPFGHDHRRGRRIPLLIQESAQLSVVGKHNEICLWGSFRELRTEVHFSSWLLMNEEKGDTQLVQVI